MRVAGLYDVHGNEAALDAVLADPRCVAADLVVCGGDLVAGPFPAACLDRLVSLGNRVRFVRGNGDREVVQRSEGHGGRWCAEHLGSERLALVETWPLSLRLPVAGGTTFCHATPRADDEIVTQLTPVDELATALAGAGASTVVAGHTHVQVDRRDAADCRFVNAGSVGRPYEGRPGAFWALVDDDTGIELVRTDYDVAAAAGAIRSSGHPDAAAHADQLLQPPSPGEVSALFEGLRGT